MTQFYYEHFGGKVQCFIGVWNKIYNAQIKQDV